MKTIRGKFNGSVVILEEPAPVDHEVSVLIEFPEEEGHSEPDSVGRFHWKHSRVIGDNYDGNVADAVLTHRRIDEADAS